MRLGYDLTIEQKQQLAMTPELIQAIKILQLNNIDLFEYVQNELLENPILEEERREKETDLMPTMVEIRDRMAEDNYFDDNFKHWENDPNREDRSYEQFVSAEQTLQDFLLEQLQLSNLVGEEKRICRYIIEGIDENGYLTLSMDEMTQEMGCTEEAIEQILEFIHQMEPCGVGARNLAECIEIQLASRGLLTEEMEYIVENLLEDVANNKISRIAKTLGMKTEDVQHAIDLIRSLEPKPGRQFAGAGETIRYVIPDIIVEKVDGEYTVRSNDSSIPRLMVSSYYHTLSQAARQDDELNHYLSGRFNSAMWLIRSIEQRKQTILGVAAAIVRYQKDFFDKGEQNIKTLTLKQISSEVGVHESTVSRAINGKYMQSPRGVFELKYFFSSGVTRSGSEDGVSSNSIKSMIREMVNQEDPRKPMSDQDMVAVLQEKGIEISRRTVAKYREGMGIQSSSKRRRFG